MLKKIMKLVLAFFALSLLTVILDSLLMSIPHYKENTNMMNTDEIIPLIMDSAHKKKRKLKIVSLNILGNYGNI